MSDGTYHLNGGFKPRMKRSGAPEGSKNGNYKHGRYTKEVTATRQWLREATHMLRDLKKRPE
jgi:hypothetical protein